MCVSGFTETKDSVTSYEGMRETFVAEKVWHSFDRGVERDFGNLKLIKRHSSDDASRRRRVAKTWLTVINELEEDVDN